MEDLNSQNEMEDLSEKTVEFSTRNWRQSPKNTPVFAVVSAVADASEQDISELPPLYEAVNPEAMNDLFTSQPNSSIEKLTFQYAGYDVVVCENGQVQVRSVTSSPA